MGKRAVIFAILIFTVLPVLAVALTLGGIFFAAEGKGQEAYEVFFKQNTVSGNILLADKGGNAFMVCMPEEGNTRLISILPTACPKGEEDCTFLSVYREKGIKGLQEKIENSLSCTIAGYLMVDFSGLGPMVDALGSVEIAGKTYSGQALGNYLQTLGGNSQGAYAQQDAVLAVGRRFCSAGFWKGQNALRKLLKVTDTNLSLSALVKIGSKLIPALEGKGLHRYCLPDAGRWESPVFGLISQVK